VTATNPSARAARRDTAFSCSAISSRGVPADAVERDDLLTGAAQEWAWAVARFAADTGVDETLEKEWQGDLSLETRERRTEAAMDPAAETEMLVILSVRVELAGGRELCAVAIRRGQQQDDLNQGFTKFGTRSR
jgi:hypothetical protein